MASASDLRVSALCCDGTCAKRQTDGRGVSLEVVTF